MAACGYAYVRYADDFCILSREKPELEQAVSYTKGFLRQQLKLTLSECELACVTHGFSFLGMYYDGQSLDISEAKKSKHREELAYTFRTAKLVALPQFVIKLNEIIAGWQNYYGRLLDVSRLDYLRKLLVDNLSGLIRDKLKNNELSSYKNAASALDGLVWGEKAESQRLIKDVLAQTRIQTAKISGNNHKPGNTEVCAPGHDTNRAIAGKKRKYQRLQARECDLVVSTPGAFIGKQNRQVVVKCQGKLSQRIAEVNLKQILIISYGVSLSSDVIKHCTEKAIPIHFLTYDAKPYALIYSPLYPTLELGARQLEAGKSAQGVKLACCIVAGKIKNQASLIKYCSKYRKDWDTDFAQGIDRFIRDMGNFGREIKALRETDIDIARGKLFSIEGRAAAYWEMFITVVNNKVEFAGREWRGASDLVNSMLNYGYGILYSRIWLALSLAELNLHISFLHKEQPNKPTLVYDFIEEFRQPVVDRAIISLINRGGELKMDGALLTKETRDKVAVAVLERLNTPLKFRGRNMNLSEIINCQARRLADCIKEGKGYRPYLAKW